MCVFLKHLHVHQRLKNLKQLNLYSTWKWLNGSRGTALFENFHFISFGWWTRRERKKWKIDENCRFFIRSLFSRIYESQFTSSKWRASIKEWYERGKMVRAFYLPLLNSVEQKSQFHNALSLKMITNNSYIMRYT